MLSVQVNVRTVLFKDRGATLLQTIQHMPALADLDISYRGFGGRQVQGLSETHGLPRCEELAQLHSLTLTSLSVCMLDGPTEGTTLRLSGLPELRACTLTASSRMPLNMRTDGASFQDMQLQDMYINDRALQLERGSLAQLAALTSLSLGFCGLHRVPSDVASCSATLRELYLSDNDRLQIDSEAVASILQCSQLNLLELYKGDVSEWEGSLACWPQVNEYLDNQQFTPS